MIGSLFSGVGIIEAGLQQAGLGRVLWQVEIDAWCRGVLAMHWPNAARHADVRRVGAHNLQPVQVMCGGFPCQDISTPGRRAGIDGARSGLWREFARIVGELRPRVVVIENVAQLVARGLDRVVADLDALGYRVEGRLIQARDVGAPHGRERLFLVAYTGNHRFAERGQGDDDRGGDAHGPLVDRRDPGDRGPFGGAEPGLGRNADGLADWVDRWPARPGEPPFVWEPPRAAALSSPTRTRRLHALGNGAVLAVCREVGLRVRELLGDDAIRPQHGPSHATNEA